MSMAYNNVIEQALDDNGIPLEGAKLRFYDAGTTTPRTVYSDSGLTTAITQPVVADAAGRFVQVYLQAGIYKYTLHTADDVLVTSQDNVDPGLSASGSAIPIAQGGTGATTAAGARTNLDVPATSVTDGLDTRLADVEAELAAPITEAVVVDSYAASYTPVFTTNPNRAIILTGSVTVNAPTATAGTGGRLFIIQDGTGGRTASWNSAWKFAGGTPPNLSRTADAVDGFYWFARTSGIIEVFSYKIQDAFSGGFYDVLLEDQKASGTSAGSSTTGSDVTRTLNTEVYDPKGYCALSSNQFTLIGPATYQVHWSAPAMSTLGHQSILYDVTAAADLKRGSSETISNGGTYASNRSEGVHTVSISGATNTYEIRQRFAVATGTHGLGLQAGVGTETYTWVRIKRIA
jgi:hypothetical protein